MHPYKKIQNSYAPKKIKDAREKNHGKNSAGTGSAAHAEEGGQGGQGGQGCAVHPAIPSVYSWRDERLLLAGAVLALDFTPIHSDSPFPESPVAVS